MISPKALKQQFPVSERISDQIKMFRQNITEIINAQDKRFLIICGPCSIHDPKAALEYAKLLKAFADKTQDKFFVVMRVYFEKPRTTVGWKGLINDPLMDNSFDIENGLKIARKLLVDIANLGLPIAAEALDLNTPHYLSDLVSWMAIGARTTESQIHREMASGFEMPIGFKNGTDGNFQIAINAMHSASISHQFLGIDQDGQLTQIKTKGNNATHLILRGSGDKPNYDAENVQKAEYALTTNHLQPRLVIDCSHGNAQKDHKKQLTVLASITEQINDGNQSILGIMLESNLFEGNQLFNRLEHLKYGVSMTDPCISWETTEQALMELYKQI